MRKGILAIFLSLIFCFSSVANAVVDGVISAEEAPYGRVVIPDDKLILEKEVKKSIETGDSAAAKSQALNVLNAEAGNDKSVLKNEMVVFDAVNTSVPREVKASDVEYVWDFDDGSYGATGKQVVHRFISEGVYRVKLTVKAGGKESSDQMVVSVFSNQVILLSDEDLSDSLSNELGAKFSLEHTNVIHLKQLNTLGSDSFKEEAMLSQLMANYSEGLRSTSFIFVHGDVGLRVLSRIQTKMNLDFDSKNIIFLNEGDLSWFKKKFLSLFYRQLNPKRLIYANYDFSFSDFIRGDFSDYKMIDGKGVGFVTKFLAKFLSLGYSFQTVYFLMVIFLVNIIGLVFRRVIGLTSADIFMTSLCVLAMMQLGFIPGIGAYFFFSVLSFALHHIFNRYSMMLLPWNVMKYAGFMVILLSALVISSSLYPDVGLDMLFFPLLVLSFSADIMSVRVADKDLMSAVLQVLQELALLFVSYFIVTIPFVISFVMTFPGPYLLILLAIGVLVEKYTGLRLVEYKRFRNLLNKIEE